MHTTTTLYLSKRPGHPALYPPTTCQPISGREGTPIAVHTSQHTSGALVLRIEAEGSLPVLHRALAHAIDFSVPIETVR